MICNACNAYCRQGRLVVWLHMRSATLVIAKTAVLMTAAATALVAVLISMAAAVVTAVAAIVTAVYAAELIAGVAAQVQVLRAPSFLYALSGHSVTGEVCTLCPESGGMVCAGPVERQTAFAACFCEVFASLVASSSCQ